MVIMVNTSLSLTLLTLVAGLGLLVWSMRNEGAGVKLAQIGGYLVTILAVLTLLCSAYHGLKHMGKSKMRHHQGMEYRGQMHNGGSTMQQMKQHGDSMMQGSQTRPDGR